MNKNRFIKDIVKVGLLALRCNVSLNTGRDCEGDINI
jgi:hypothetical protein